MTEKQICEIVYDLIKESVKDKTFTFENLSVEVDSFEVYYPNVVVKFKFKKNGNINKSIT